jgi:hypothetical protein
MKGISEIEVSGRKRGFKFGTYQLSIVCELEKCSLSELSNKLRAANLSTVLNVLYAGAVSYCKSNKIDIDFEVVDVADWMDEIGLDQGMQIINKGLQSEDKKKEEPGKVNGELSLQSKSV